MPIKRNDARADADDNNIIYLEDLIDNILDLEDRMDELDDSLPVFTYDDGSNACLKCIIVKLSKSIVDLEQKLEEQEYETMSLKIELQKMAKK